MSVVTQLYFQFVEENNYIFRPFSGWAIIRLRLEHREKLIYFNVDIKHGERDLVLQCLLRFLQQTENTVVLRRTLST
jgi:hypothetical protein